MAEQILGNGLCWVILLLAVICYQQLWSAFLVYRYERKISDTNEVFNQLKADEQVGSETEFSGTLIGVLPLVGLLGTIVGLLDCFAGMASGGASSELISGGIADALITTQLGLVCAIPGWLLQAYVRSRVKTGVKERVKPQTDLNVETIDRSSTEKVHPITSGISESKPERSSVFPPQSQLPA